MPQTKEERIAILDKMTRKAMANKKEVHALTTSIMCFAPDNETLERLEAGLKMIERAMQDTASYHADRKRKLIREA